MRAVCIGAISALAAAATATSTNTTCATGLYILGARGSGENVTYSGYPDYMGSTGPIGIMVASKVNGSVLAGVHYPATNPVPDNINLTDPKAVANINLTGYYNSDSVGASAIIDEINQYHSACPTSKIALIGYSQGAQVVRDALCGGIGGKFSSNAPLAPALVEQSIVAVALMGDPTHIAGESIDRGTSTNNGRFPRTNITVCQQYDSFTASWCDKNDAFCDDGDSIAVHESYLETYKEAVTKFIVDKYTNATSGSNATTTTTATGTPTGSTTSASSTQTGSASTLGFGQSSSLGAAVSLALWVLI